MREKQIVHYVAEGMGNREIAMVMNLRENTVKNYIFRIYEKLGLSNRVELARYAIEHLSISKAETEGYSDPISPNSGS